MRGGVSMAPMSRVRHADALDPMDLHAAGLAVENLRSEFAVELDLHGQELLPEHPGRNRDLVIGR